MSLDKWAIFFAVLIGVIAVSKYYSIICKRFISAVGPVIVPGYKKSYKKFVKFDEKISGTERIYMSDYEKAKLKEKNQNDDFYRYQSIDFSNPNTYKSYSTTIIGLLLAVMTVNYNKTYGKILINMLVLNIIFEVVDCLIAVITKKKKVKLKKYEEMNMWDKAFYSQIPQLIISIIILVITGW